jgi:RND family efflux transporter MFP subunit
LVCDSFSIVAAHDGENHNEPATTIANTPVVISRAERTITTASGRWLVTLRQIPGQLHRQQTVKWAIRLEKLAADATSNRTVINPTKITSTIQNLVDKQLIAKDLIWQPTATGDYRSEYQFPTAGDFQLQLALLAEGQQLTTEFPLTVVALPPRYTPYILDLVVLAIVCGLIGLQYRTLSASSKSRFGPRFASQAALVLIIGSGLVALVHYTIPVTAELPTVDWPATTLAEHKSDDIVLPKQMQFLFGIRTLEVSQQLLANKLTIPAVVRMPSTARAQLVAPVEGQLKAVGSFNVGSYVEKGEVLATIDEVLSVSEEASVEAALVELQGKTAEIRATADQATIRQQAAEVELNRARQLYDAGAAPLKRVQEAEAQVKLAEQEIKAARQRISLNQIGEKRITPEHIFALHAPISGTIENSNFDTVHFSTGEQVEAGKTLLTIVNLEQMWIEAQVFEKDLATVLATKQATCRITAFPDELITLHKQGENRFLTLGTQLNPENRTLPIIYQIKNPGIKLRDGMTAEITFDVSIPREVITVPQTAIVTDQGQTFVYVYQGGEHFSRRLVKVGAISLDQAEIISGLNVSERVVVAGVYQLRAMSR